MNKLTGQCKLVVVAYSGGLRLQWPIGVCVPSLGQIVSPFSNLRPPETFTPAGRGSEKRLCACTGVYVCMQVVVCVFISIFFLDLTLRNNSASWAERSHLCLCLALVSQLDSVSMVLYG